MKRLLKQLDAWKYLLAFSLLLGFVSAIFSILGPNYLSDLANAIQKGLVPNTSAIQEISTEITSNLTMEGIQLKAQELLNGDTLTTKEKQSLMDTLTKAQSVSSYEEMYPLITSLPTKITQEFLSDIVVEGTTISSEDQAIFIQKMGSMNQTDTSEVLNTLYELPDSIQNVVKGKIDEETVRNTAILLGSLYVLSAIFGFIQSLCLATISNRFAQKLRSNISAKINRLPLKYFDAHETGDVLSRVTNDVDSIASNMNQSLSTLVTSATLFLGSIIMMFVTNWTMATTAILSSVLGFAAMGFLLGKSQKYFNQRQKELGDLNGHIEEIYSGHNVVKAYNGETIANQEFDEINERLYVCNQKSQFLSGIMQPCMGFIGNFGYVAVCVVGALLAINGSIQIGTIVAFMIYIRLFTNPLSQMAQAFSGLQSTAAAAERVFEFMDEEEMKDESSFRNYLDKKHVKGAISFDHVHFGYNPGRTIIKDFTIDVKPGQKVAIVGPTGAGKTTMVNLLMKFYEINEGSIKIDGVPTSALTRENIHDLFVMVLQDTWLFEGTIRENLAFNQTKLTDKEIWNACRVVGVDHFIQTLPGGLDAILSENDAISSGQKQLMTIARGMLKDAPFLILDEATSNVDTRTEELVQQAMDKLTVGKTSFIIAHRLSTIKNADIILVMNEGNIIEQGNHESLMKQKGFYYDLYNSQFKK